MPDYGSKFVAGEWVAARNLEIIRKRLLNMPRETAARLGGITLTSLNHYEAITASDLPKLKATARLCKLYGVPTGNLVSEEYDIFWCGSPEAEDVLTNCLAGLGENDLTPYADEAVKHMSRFFSPNTEHVVRGVMRDFMREAVADISKKREEPVDGDEEICQNLTANLKHLMALCSVSLKKITAKTGISPKTGTAALNGEDVVLGAAIKFADYFGVSLGELLKRDANFGDEAAIAGDVATGPKYEHKMRNVRTAAYREYNRQVNTKLSRAEAETMIRAGFARTEEKMKGGKV